MASERGLTVGQRIVKRVLDLFLASVGLVLTGPLLALGWYAARRSTGASGLFRQERIGRGGEPFEVLKLRTMVIGKDTSTITVRTDARITPVGRVLRRFKLDELPQLINILRGDMSVVGPRPDVRGYADVLEGDDRIILSVRPGITSPASLAYRHEESMLAVAHDPKRFNDEVIWPDKVRMNREYVEGYSLRSDIACIGATLASIWSRAPLTVEERAVWPTDC